MIKQRKYACIVAYDGTAYSGFQIQSRVRTIQGEIENVLQRMHRTGMRITGAGRTDAGVHARGQVFHFESHLQLSEEQWMKALNAGLPEDIRIQTTRAVPKDFHARYDSVTKEYRYFIDHQTVRDPLRRLYTHHIAYDLDIESMQSAAELLIGQHDFSAFSSPSDVQDKTRIVYTLEVMPKGTEIVIKCVGNGFLYHMMRIIAGTLIEVGQGKRDPETIRTALEKKDRSLAGVTAPAQGLCLWKVTYPEQIEKLLSR